MSAHKISAALDRAKNICVVEEAVDIAGNRLVVRSLRPADYENIAKSTEGATTEAEYIYAWQKAHICYALVEVNGVDFRGVDFIEVEETKGEKKTVKLEVPTYLRDHLVSTWSKEAVYTVYRKVGDAVSRAEATSSEGIKFLIPEEGPEDTYRRLVGEMRDIEDDVPPALLNTILEEHGLMRKSTAAEIKSAMEKEGQAAWEEIQRKKKVEETPPVPPCESTMTTPMKTVVRCELPKGHPPASPDGDHRHENILWDDPPVLPRPTPTMGTPESFEKRVPLNQMAVNLPQPQAAQPVVTPAVRNRTAEIAALEGDAGLSLPPDGVEIPENVALLAKKQTPVNPREVSKVLDRPPSVGLNPKFRSPPR